jgi:hypothetical protein
MKIKQIAQHAFGYGIAEKMDTKNLFLDLLNVDVFQMRESFAPLKSVQNYIQRKTRYFKISLVTQTSGDQMNETLAQAVV